MGGTFHPFSPLPLPSLFLFFLSSRSPPSAPPFFSSSFFSSIFFFSSFLTGSFGVVCVTHRTLSSPCPQSQPQSQSKPTLKRRPLGGCPHGPQRRGTLAGAFPKPQCESGAGDSVSVSPDTNEPPIPLLPQLVMTRNSEAMSSPQSQLLIGPFVSDFLRHFIK